MKLGRVTLRGKSRSLASTLAGLALSLAAAGCGGDGGGGGACGVTPCGGDVVGTWQASSSCVDQATLNMEFLAGIMGSCPSASLGNVGLTPSGSVAFTADMMFTGTISVDSTIPIIFPAACTNGASCADLTAVLQALVGSNGITSATCVGSGACTCTVAQTFDSINDTGTWATSGTTLTITGAASGAQANPYCVQGSSLHLLEFDSGGMMKVVGDIVLSKQ
jgi:hypothetical protein